MAANSDQFVEKPKFISVATRMQALMLAQMNDEKAELCGKGQEPLRAFFEMNSKFLMEIAK